MRDPFLRFGHTSLVAARILLQSRGVCAGCDKNTGLRGLAARDRIHIHTVDPPPRGSEPADWPAVVCNRCRDTMGDNFLEFRSHAICSARSATPVARSERSMGCPPPRTSRPGSTSAAVASATRSGPARNAGTDGDAQQRSGRAPIHQSLWFGGGDGHGPRLLRTAILYIAVAQ